MKLENKKAEAFFQNWKKKDWRKMHVACQITWKDGEGNTAEALEAMFGKTDLLQFKVSEEILTSSNSGLLVRLPTSIVTKNILGKVQTKVGFVTLVREIGVRTPSKKGTWGVNPISALRGVEQ